MAWRGARRGLCVIGSGMLCHCRWVGRGVWGLLAVLRGVVVLFFMDCESGSGASLGA